MDSNSPRGALLVQGFIHRKSQSACCELRLWLRLVASSNRSSSLPDAQGCTRIFLAPWTLSHHSQQSVRAFRLLAFLQGCTLPS